LSDSRPTEAVTTGVGEMNGSAILMVRRMLIRRSWGSYLKEELTVGFPSFSSRTPESVVQ
jgi:hypothetical protein